MANITVYQNSEELSLLHYIFVVIFEFLEMTEVDHVRTGLQLQQKFDIPG